MSILFLPNEGSFKFSGSYSSVRDDVRIKDKLQVLKTCVESERCVIFKNCTLGKLLVEDKEHLTKLCSMFGVSCTFED